MKIKERWPGQRFSLTEKLFSMFATTSVQDRHLEERHKFFRSLCKYAKTMSVCVHVNRIDEYNAMYEKYRTRYDNLYALHLPYKMESDEMNDLIRSFIKDLANFL